MRSSVVVLFHRPLSKEWFQNAIETLERYFQIISVNDFHQQLLAKSLKRKCLITFDDGDKSVYENAYPVLKSKGYQAILFVSPQIIQTQKNYWFQEIGQMNKLRQRAFYKDIYHYDIKDGEVGVTERLKSKKYCEIEQFVAQILKEIESKPQNLTPNQFLEMIQEGVIVPGAHTINHPILKNESLTNAENEIIQSVIELEKMVGNKVKYFAYPNGVPNLDFTKREYNAIEKAGVELAFSCRNAMLKPTDDLYALPRIEISDGGRLKLTMKTYYGPRLFGSYFEKRYSNLQFQNRKAGT
ncbi:MAG: polysaccharide deacetylase family protein [Bacteroidetes bacterium]|nr:polysaccharide deacetylase family protein [Bacteroidota bacterium]